MKFPMWLGIILVLAITTVWAYSTVTEGVDPVLTALMGTVAGGVLGIAREFKRRNNSNS